jgi:hypothetical protein
MSLVLTLGTLIAGLLVASGCVRSQVTSNQQAVQIAPVTEAVTESVNESPELLVSPKEELKPLPPAIVDSAPTVKEPPPRPQIELLGKPPGPDVTWLPGHWEWDGDWTWRAGRWIAIPAPNASWVPGRWVRQDDGWVWVEGFWRMASLK